MKFPEYTAGILLLLLASRAPVALAEEQAAAEFFQQGVTAAQRGDNQGAVRGFESARRAGMTSPALYYNLGVIYYRMKIYAWSEENFEKLTHDPTYAALAYYNLGLIAANRDNIDLALKNFLTCYSTTNDNSLKALSALAIKRVSGTTVSDEESSGTRVQKVKDPPLWRGIVLFSFARDDNVGLTNDDLKDVTGVSQESDNYIELLATMEGFILGDNQSGLRLSGFANVQSYTRQNIKNLYDYRQFHLGVSRVWESREWRLEYGLGLDQVDFGGTDFEKVYGAFLQGRRYLERDKTLTLLIGSSRINADPLYSYLDGSKQQLKIDFSVPQQGWKYRVVYNLEFNHREDYQTSTIYRSYSPIRNELGLIGYIDFGRAWQTRWELQYRNSIYRHEDVLDASTNNNFTRVDNRYRFNAGLIYNISPKLQWLLDYSHARNNSNRIDLTGTNLSDYTRNVVSTSLVWYY